MPLESTGELVDALCQLEVDLGRPVEELVLGGDGSVLSFVPRLLKEKEEEMKALEREIDGIWESIPGRSMAYVSKMEEMAVSLEDSIKAIEAKRGMATVEEEELKPTVEDMSGPLEQLSQLSSISGYVSAFKRATKLSSDLLQAMYNEESAKKSCEIFLSLLGLLPASHHDADGGEPPPSSSLRLYGCVFAFCEENVEQVKGMLMGDVQGVSKQMEWGKDAERPFGSSLTEEALASLKSSFSRLMTFQIGWERVSPFYSKPEEPGKTASSLVWAVEAFAQPLISRFIFHFGSGRDTDRIDRPGWAFTWLKESVDRYLPFVMKELQPTILAAVREVMGVSGLDDAFDSRSDLESIAASVRERVPGRYHSMNCGHQLLSTMVHTEINRLNTRYDFIIADNAVYSRTLEQAVEFDIYLNTHFHYSEDSALGVEGESELRAVSPTKGRGGQLYHVVPGVFSTSKDRFDWWMSVDVEHVEKRLAEMCENPNAWSRPPTGADSSEIADGVARMLISLEKRLGVLQSDQHRHTYITRVHFSLLRRFLSSASLVQTRREKVAVINSLVRLSNVTSRLRFQYLSLTKRSSNPKDSAIEHVEKYMPQLVRQFWSVAATSASTVSKVALKGLVGQTGESSPREEARKMKAQESVASVFVPIFHEFKAVRHQIMDELVEKTLHDFQRRALSYYNEWHDRTNPYDGSNRKTNFSGALNNLGESLGELGKGLSKDMMRDILRVAAIRIDHLFFDNVIVGTVFIDKAVRELESDLRAIHLVLNNLDNEYAFDGFFRLSIESCLMLNMNRAERSGLVTALKQLSLGHPNRYPFRWKSSGGFEDGNGAGDKDGDEKAALQGVPDHAHVEMHNMLVTRNIWAMHPEHACALGTMRL